MSGNLDRSLDEILATSRASSKRGSGPRGRGRPRRAHAARTQPAPAGGIKKNTKSAKGVVKLIPKGPGGNESKILVSNLPKDVTDKLLKEYLESAVVPYAGPVKKHTVENGPGGSKATIIFARSTGATDASDRLDGLLIDGRPLKVEVMLTAKQAAAVIAPAKSLSERIAAPKSKPKSAATTKTASTRGKARGTRTRGGRTARPAKKTAEELDSEMADYFGGAGAENPTGGAAQPTNGDANMEDEILGHGLGRKNVVIESKAAHFLFFEI
ncbi:hypothetical protein B7494_g6540 [Chlorociboria aeruginascens]|nr:hypothetical protein B7494_g6540 [Chlorociboria aeruginascens]